MKSERRKKDQRVGDVLWRPHALRRNLLCLAFQIGLVLTRRGQDQPRGNGVDLDLGRQRQRQPLGHCNDRRLGQRVCDMIGTRTGAPPVGDIDDVPGPLLSHVGGKGLAQEKGRLEVDGKVPVPVVLRRVVPVAGLKNGRAVYQDVHLAKVRLPPARPPTALRPAG